MPLSKIAYDFHTGHIHHPPIQPVHAPLYVVACISNPVRYGARYRHYRQFEKYMEDSGAILYTVELGFGEREFEITEKHNPRHIQLRSYSEIWHKENMLNIAINRLPPDWQYVAWIDADVQFARPDWVTETVHQLQHYMFLQLFSQAIDLGPNHQPIGSVHNGFVYSYLNDIDAEIDANPDPGGTYYGNYGHATWHPGYAWAARREAIDHVGGLIDWAILGSADRHMAHAMIGRVQRSLYPNINKSYIDWCVEWQNRCETYIKRDIGYMDGLLYHYWHGRKILRGYDHRWRILVDDNYDPVVDLKRDWQGLWALTDHNIKLRDDIRKYLRSRREDSTDL